MRRREFIILGGAATAWQLASRAEQAPLPVIGSLSSGSAESWRPLIAGFLDALKEAGLVEGKNVHIEYRWADGQCQALPPSSPGARSP